MPRIIAYRHGHRVGINTGLRLLHVEGGNLRAAVQMNFDYVNAATALTGAASGLSGQRAAEQRAATMNAVLAASGIKEEVESGETENVKETKTETVDIQSQDISILYLLDFGAY